MQAELGLNHLVETYAGLEGSDLISTVLRDHPGRVAMLSSFGAESAVLLHMVSRIEPSLPVLFLNTGKLFPETLDYRQALVRQLGLEDVRDVQPTPDDLAATDPDGKLHEADKDLCCHIRKTVPMERALAGFDVIISGRKRFHGAARSDLEFVTFQDGRIKIEPLAGYSALDLKNYVQANHLPQHPLVPYGYRSIGCLPCTVAGGNDTDPRAGRWVGTGKTECGIHIAGDGSISRLASPAGN